MKTEEERPRQQWLGRKMVFVACLIVGVIGLGLAVDANSSDSESPCDRFATVAIDRGGTGGGSSKGDEWDEAILGGLRITNYFGQHPGVDEDDAVGAMPETPSGDVVEVTLDLDGEPQVSLQRAGDGWFADGASFCT